MGSIDIPPFLRDKMRKEQEAKANQLPPFLKKKESGVSNVGGSQLPSKDLVEKGNVDLKESQKPAKQPAFQPFNKDQFDFSIKQKEKFPVIQFDPQSLAKWQDKVGNVQEKNEADYANKVVAAEKNVKTAIEGSGEYIRDYLFERKKKELFSNHANMMRSDNTFQSQEKKLDELYRKMPQMVVSDNEVEEAKPVVKENFRVAKQILHKKYNKEKDNTLARDLYLLDSHKRIEESGNLSVVGDALESSDKIEKGEAPYDFASGHALDPQGFISSFFLGLKHRGEQMSAYEVYSSGDKDKIKEYLKEKQLEESQETPTKMPNSGVGSIGEMFGGSAIELAKGVGAATVTTAVTKNPLAGMVAAATINTVSDYQRSYASAFEETYKRALDGGKTEDEAIAIASKEANAEGIIGSTEGAVMNLIGAKLGMKKYAFSKSAQNIAERFLEKASQVTKQVAPELVANTGVAVGGRIARNVASNEIVGTGKDISEGTLDAAKGALVFTGVFAGLTAFGRTLLTPKEYKAHLEAAAKMPPEVVKDGLDLAVADGLMKPEDASEAVVSLEDFKSTTDHSNNTDWRNLDEVKAEREYYSDPSRTFDWQKELGKKQMELLETDPVKYFENKRDVKSVTTGEFIRDEESRNQIQQTIDKIKKLLESESTPETTEVVPTEEPVRNESADEPSSLESKKLDIEKRRQEELNKIKENPISEERENSQSINEINAKYDAELAALGEENPIPKDESTDNAATPKVGEETSQEQSHATEELPSPTRDESDLTGITHKQMDETAEELGFDKYEKDPENFELWDKEAQDRLNKDGRGAIDKMMNRLRDGKVDDPVDQRLMIRYVSSLKAKIRAGATPELLAEFKRAKDVSNISGRQLGKSLVARKAAVPVEDSLAEYLHQRSEDKGFPLSDEQIKEETAKFDEHQSAQKEYQDALKEQEKRESEAKAEKEFNKIKKAAKGKNKTREQFSAERKSFIEELKAAKKEHEDFLKDQGIQQSGIGGIALTPKMAKAIAKLIKSYAEEGVQKLGELTDKVYEEIKDFLPSITKADINDVIAGAYREKGETKSKKNADLREMQQEAKLLKQIADERKGLSKERSTTAKAKKSKRIEELETKLKELKSANKKKDAGDSEDDLSYSGVKAKREKLLQKIHKLQEDIKNKNYEPDEPTATKPTKPLDPKTQALQDKVIELERKLMEDKLRDQRENRNAKEKALDLTDEALQVKRLVETSSDVSVSLRQLSPLFKPNTIKIWADAFGAQVRSIFNQKHYDRLMYAIRNSPLFREMIAMGVRFNELPTKSGKTEHNELMAKQTNFIYKIPVVGDILRSSQRAADAALNTARFELYVKMRNSLMKKGITPESDPHIYEQVAKWVMNNTGSGNMLKQLESPGMQKLMGHTFYGSKLMASRMNMLNPLYYAKMPKELRMQIWGDAAWYATTVMTMGLGLKAAGAEISLDPDDGDFLQVRFGDKVYDITGGFASYTRTFFRALDALTSGAYRTKYETNKKQEKARNSTITFFRNKLAPNTSYAVNAILGKDSRGNDFKPLDIIKIYPMYLDDAIDGISKEGMTATLTVLLPNLLGVGYGAWYSDKEAGKQSLSEIIERNTKSDEYNKDNLKNYNDGGRAVTDEEFQKFIDLRDNKIEAAIKKAYDEGRLMKDENGIYFIKKFTDFSKEEVIKETTAIKSAATKETKEELFGKKPTVRKKRKTIKD